MGKNNTGEQLGGQENFSLTLSPSFFTKLHLRSRTHLLPNKSMLASQMWFVHVLEYHGHQNCVPLGRNRAISPGSSPYLFKSRLAGMCLFGCGEKGLDGVP